MEGIRTPRAPEGGGAKPKDGETPTMPELDPHLYAGPEKNEPTMPDLDMSPLSAEPSSKSGPDTKMPSMQNLDIHTFDSPAEETPTMPELDPHLYTGPEKDTPTMPELDMSALEGNPPSDLLDNDNDTKKPEASDPAPVAYDVSFDSVPDSLYTVTPEPTLSPDVPPIDTPDPTPPVDSPDMPPKGPDPFTPTPDIHEPATPSPDAPHTAAGGDSIDAMLDLYTIEHPLRMAVINQDADLKAKARFMGENKLAERLNSRTGLRKILGNIWQGGIARGYYRQKFINEAREQLLAEGSLAHDAGAREQLADDDARREHDRESRQYNRAVTELFLDEVAQLAPDDKRESLPETHPAYAQIKDIVMRFADGSLATEEDANREFRAVVQSIGQEYSEGHLSISNITDVAVQARNRFEDMKTVVEAQCGRFDHDKAMERVMKGFEIMYGENKMERRTPKGNTVDKVIDKLEQTKIGSIVPPATLALATAAAMSASEFMGKKAVGAMCAVVPGLSGAIFSGVKASATFEQERSRAFYDERYGRKVESGDKRGEKIRETVYDHHSAHDIAESLLKGREVIEKAKGEGKDLTALHEAYLQQIAMVKFILDSEMDGNSILKFSSERDAPEEKLDLLQQFARAKNYLRDVEGGTYADLDDKLDDRSDLMQRTVDSFHASQHEKDKAARSLKIKTILKKSGTSFLVGAACGLGMQEIRACALFDKDDQLQGLLEKGTSSDSSARLTALAKARQGLFGLFGKNTGGPEVKLNANLDIATGEVIQNNGEMSFAKASDGTYTLMRDGKEVAKGINWNAETGKLTPDSLKTLRDQGLTVTNTGNMEQSITKMVADTQSREVSLDEWYKGAGNGMPIRRIGWWDNDTPQFDKNELAGHYYTDPDTGAHGLITRMTDAGSSHGGEVSQFSQWVQEGKVKLMISPSGATQQTPIEVLGKVMPDGQIAFIPEEGSVAARFFDSDGKFIGKFAEIVQDCGYDEDGVTKLIRPFATAVGQDYTGTLPIFEDIEREVTDSLSVPEYLFTMPGENGITDWELPIVFPFTYDGAMKNSAPGDYANHDGRRRIRYHGGYYQTPYGGVSVSGETEPGTPAAELGPDGRSIVKGEISERITARKQLHLGQEVADYKARMVAAGEQDRATRIEQIVEQSPTLKNLSGSVKTVIMLPVWAKEDFDKVYDALSLYAQQEGVSMDSFMVCVNVNDKMPESADTVDSADLTDDEKAHFASIGNPNPSKAEVYRHRYQQTIAEVGRAKTDFPGLQVATISQAGHNGIFDVTQEMNDAVLFAIDRAVREGRMDADNDVLMVRNDCDVKHISSHYVASFQEAAQKNPKTPIFTGTTYFNIDHQRRVPGLGAATQIERMSNLLGAVNGRVHTAGGNFGYRASHFAAINGYGFAANGDDMSPGAGSDDLRIGHRLQDAFDSTYWERMRNSGNPSDGDLMDPSTRMLVRVGEALVDTDNLRYLKFYADGGFHEAGPGVTNDAYRPDNQRPADVKARGYNGDDSRGDWSAWKAFYEDVDGPNMEVIADRFAAEMTDYISCCDGDKHGERYWERLLAWWLGSPNNGYYTLTREADTTRRYNGMRTVLQFTDEGKQKLRESLIRRITGDGSGTQDVNNFQQAISDGRWASRASA